MEEKEYLVDGLIEVVKDEPRLRRILLDNGIERMLSRAGEKSIVGGACLENEKGVIAAVKKDGKLMMLGYMITKEMTVDEALPIIKAIADAIGLAVGVSPTHIHNDPTSNN